MKVEIVGADHQNKPDVGSNIVRRWIGAASFSSFLLQAQASKAQVIGVAMLAGYHQLDQAGG